jgi:hypothetical protein
MGLADCIPKTELSPALAPATGSQLDGPSPADGVRERNSDVASRILAAAPPLIPGFSQLEKAQKRLATP